MIDNEQQTKYWVSKIGQRWSHRDMCLALDSPQYVDISYISIKNTRETGIKTSVAIVPMLDPPGKSYGHGNGNFSWQFGYSLSHGCHA